MTMCPPRSAASASSFAASSVSCSEIRTSGRIGRRLRADWNDERRRLWAAPQVRLAVVSPAPLLAAGDAVERAPRCEYAMRCALRELRQARGLVHRIADDGVLEAVAVADVA